MLLSPFFCFAFLCVSKQILFASKFNRLLVTKFQRNHQQTKESVKHDVVKLSLSVTTQSWQKLFSKKEYPNIRLFLFCMWGVMKRDMYIVQQKCIYCDCPPFDNTIHIFIDLSNMDNSYEPCNVNVTWQISRHFSGHLWHDTFQVTWHLWHLDEAA